MTLDEQSGAGNVRWALIWPEGMPESAKPWAQAAAEKAAKIERKAILDTAAEQIGALRYPASKYLSFTQRQAWSIRDDALSDAMAVVERLGTVTR